VHLYSYQSFFPTHTYSEPGWFKFPLSHQYRCSLLLNLILMNNPFGSPFELMSLGVGLKTPHHRPFQAPPQFFCFCFLQANFLSIGVLAAFPPLLEGNSPINSQVPPPLSESAPPAFAPIPRRHTSNDHARRLTVPIPPTTSEAVRPHSPSPPDGLPDALFRQGACPHRAFSLPRTIYAGGQTSQDEPKSFSLLMGFLICCSLPFLPPYSVLEPKVKLYRP